MNVAETDHTRLTAADLAAALAGERPAWVEVKATGELAIVVKVVGDAVLIRYAAPRGAYHWLSAAHLWRRADCDTCREPQWLEAARKAPTPAPILAELLRTPNPRERNAQVHPIVRGLVNAVSASVPPVGESGLDPTTREIFEEAVRVGRARARHVVDRWLVNTELDDEGRS